MTGLERLEKFVGDWTLEAVFARAAIEGDVGARASFGWTLDGAFLLERSEVDHPDAPNA